MKHKAAICVILQLGSDVNDPSFIILPS